MVVVQWIIVGNFVNFVTLLMVVVLWIILGNFVDGCFTVDYPW